MLWLGFSVLVLALLSVDLFVFHRDAHEVTVREAAIWTTIWIALALLFNVGVYYWYGTERGLEFLTGYLIEKALAVDNLFVFLVIFAELAVPPVLHHTVLFWGVIGAIVFRAAFILLGAALLPTVPWLGPALGVFLVFTGVRLLVQRGAEKDPLDNALVAAFRRVLRVSAQYEGTSFLVKVDGRRHATPLLLAVFAIEVTDVIFALDSIPAIFAITDDPFIVFTSNIFAILGLRSMYFLLAGVLTRFYYLKPGLAVILCFVGVKMFIAEYYKIPIGASLGFVLLVLGVSVALSILIPRRARKLASQQGRRAAS